MRKETLTLGGAPAVLCGEASDRVFLFVHGKDGCKEEAEAFAAVACPAGWQVAGLDLPQHGACREQPGFDPWHVVPLLQAAMAELRARFSRVALRANSIGAWFAMQSFADLPPEKCLFVSPLLDMEQLIRSMMLWAGVDEARLRREGEIPTAFGETLSARYLDYAATHRIEHWDASTAILYAGRDTLTPRETVDAFVSRFGCTLTVMEEGEHWFHTPPQLAVLQEWERAQL